MKRMFLIVSIILTFLMITIQANRWNLKYHVMPVFDPISTTSKYEKKKIDDPSYNQTTTLDTQQLVKMSGYIENVFYSQTDCTHPEQKTVVALNNCQPDWLYPTNWAMVTVNADPNANTYYIYINFYSDSTCSTVTTTDTYTEGILICASSSYGGGNLAHVISEPLYMQYDNLDYTIGIYDTLSNCQGNAFPGLVDIEYVRFGICTGYNGHDLMITSCTEEGLTGTSYTSQDFSCTGNASSITITSTDVCTTNTNDVVGLYSGYLNFWCAPGRR